MHAKKFVVAAKPQGLPKTSDFKIIEEELPALQDGEILCKAEWLTVDPYMRGAMNGLKIGELMPGEQVARVLKSRSPDYPEGTLVVCMFGWRDLTVYKVPPKEKQGFGSIYKVIDLKNLPLSYSLGTLGMPGQIEIILTIAGAVGSVVGQIAKAKGCKVLGFAGSDDKVEWLKELGFDHAFNYKTIDLHKTLQEYAPGGVDCYFDCVGGEFAYHVLKNMKPFGRIAVCGAIDSYNRDPSKLPMIPFDLGTFIYKNIYMEGFMVSRWSKEWFEGLTQLRDWVVEGKIKVQETRMEGFEAMSQAFIGLLQGLNTGKMIVRA